MRRFRGSGTTSRSSAKAILPISSTKTSPQLLNEMETRCRNMSIDLDSPPFEGKRASAIVQQLLQSHGKLEMFAMDSATIAASGSAGSLKQKALARYPSAKEADAAESHLRRILRIPQLGGTRLFLQRIFTCKLSLPRYVFFYQFQSTWPIIEGTRYSTYNNTATTTLSVATDSAQEHAALKRKPLNLLQRTSVREKNSLHPLWTRNTMTKEFSLQLQRRLNEDSNALFHDVIKSKYSVSRRKRGFV